MTDPQNPTSSGPLASRRTLLRAGGLGLLGTAVLAACGNKDEGGISGTPSASTSVPPTVPTTKPSEAQIEQNEVQLRSAQSVELLAAELYGKYGPKLTVADWRDNAARFGADHEAAAEVYAEAGKSNAESQKPNAYLTENFVQPAEEGLNNDRNILNFFYQLENLITANSINAVPILLEAEWRQQTMAFGAASARRAAVLGQGGEGVIPDSERFPLTDLMPAAAYLVPSTTAPAG